MVLSQLETKTSSIRTSQTCPSVLLERLYISGSPPSTSECYTIQASLVRYRKFSLQFTPMDDDLPDLEMPFDEVAKVMLDKQRLPLGDPNREYDDSNRELAMNNMARAQELYRDNENAALLLISDSIEMFPCSDRYLR